MHVNFVHLCMAHISEKLWKRTFRYLIKDGNIFFMPIKDLFLYVSKNTATSAYTALKRCKFRSQNKLSTCFH